LGTSNRSEKSRRAAADNNNFRHRWELRIES
jgi:hypothetical protein